MTIGAWVLVLALAVALSYGAWRARSDGRFRTPGSPGGSLSDQPDPGPDPDSGSGSLRRSRSDRLEGSSVLAGTAFADRLGEQATLLQFSSAFCAPCRVTRQVLGQVAEATPGVAHVEVDAEQHLDLVRRLHVLRTPTTLVLDATGREVTRAGGAPRRAQVEQALALT